MSERELRILPNLIETDPDVVIRCIEACFECAQACTLCADACLTEPNVAQLTACIRANLECADMCDATGRLLSRRAGQHLNLVRAFLGTCIASCASCAEACGKHSGGHEPCQACLDACRACEQACRDLLDAL